MIRIVRTEDGSDSLYNDDLKESYHSLHGAVRESRHVFVSHGLDYYRLTNKNAKEVKIFEVGFGTGLNALLTYEYAVINDLKTAYHTIESNPLDSEVYSRLNYIESIENGDLVFGSIHDAPWNESSFLHPKFQIKKIHDKLESFDAEESEYHIIYFDAFAPSKQPEMWEIGILEKVVGLLKPKGILVTYCAKGQLKRDLRDLNCDVETLDGPPGKKEMVRATKI